MTKRKKAAVSTSSKKLSATSKPEAASKSFEKAKPEWLPLHVAMMRFFPTYATEKTFMGEVRRLVTTLADANGFSVADVAPYVVRIAHDGVGLLVDAAKGEIEIEPQVVDTEWEPVFDDFEGIQGRITGALAFEVDRIRPQFREAVARQYDLALRLAGFWKASFRQAVDDGGAEIFGRCRDLMEPFKPIYPDQWHRLREAPGDWSPGTDMSTFTIDGRPGDLIIYSVQVQPHRKQESGSNRAAIECTEFLKRVMRESPNRRVPKDDLEFEARKTWSEKVLPKRAFNRCYDEAKRDVKPVGWTGRGPVANLVHSTGSRSRT